jgi:hypothetical protein
MLAGAQRSGDWVEESLAGLFSALAYDWESFRSAACRFSRWPVNWR